MPLRLPRPLARLMGTVGDAMRLGPISRTAVDQLSQGVHAHHALTEGPQPRAFSDILLAQPCGTQDLWHARLYLMRPVLRLVLRHPKSYRRIPLRRRCPVYSSRI